MNKKKKPLNKQEYMHLTNKVNKSMCRENRFLILHFEDQKI